MTHGLGLLLWSTLDLTSNATLHVYSNVAYTNSCRPLSFKLFVSCPRWSMCLSLISHMQIINIIIILVCCHNYCRARKQTFNQPEQNYCHPPWAMMFADDLVLCAMTREEVEGHLETWRVVFERHGPKISRTKTEYLPSSTHDTDTTVKIVDPSNTSGHCSQVREVHMLMSTIEYVSGG